MTEVKLIAVLLDRNNVKEAVMNILSHDMDFIENEEFFREDTLELGFENEAQRVAEELSQKFKEVNQNLINEVLTCHVGGSQFIVGNCTYTDNYTFELTDIDESRVFLSVAYA